MPNPNHPPLAPQPPRIGRPSRRNARVAGILAAILGMIAVSSQAQDRAADRLPLRALPTLSFPSVTAQGTGDQTDVLRQFRGTALQDLKNSGVFRLLNPARAAVPTGLPDARPSPAAGAELMLRFVSHSLAKGKLLIQGECVNVATGAIVLKKSFMGQTEAVDRMAHRMVDFLVGKVTGVPGAADSTLVFAKTTAHGIMEIFGMDRDGRNPRQLTAFGSLTLHPAVAGDGRLAVQDGVFLEAVQAAVGKPAEKYVVVIEEINRGNPAQILGEMLTLIEDGKRRPEEALRLAYPRTIDERVYVPDNLHIIGTMNLADRSLALVDLALRRRFSFLSLTPQLNEAWRTWSAGRGCPADLLDLIANRLGALNAAIAADASLGEQFQVGHSFVTPNTAARDWMAWYGEVVDTEIAPLLHEYWYDRAEEAKAQIARLRSGA